MYSVGEDYYDEPSEGDEAGNPNINRSDWTKTFYTNQTGIFFLKLNI